MNKFQTLAASALLVIALPFAGCSVAGGATPAPAPAPQTQEAAPAPQTQEPAPAPAPNAEEAFLLTIRSEAFFAPVPDADLLTSGNSVCNAMDVGVSIEEILNLAVSSGIPDYESGYLVGTSIGTLCPEYVPLVNEYLGL